MHKTERVRHELKRRLLTVVRKTEVTPDMIRVTLSGPDLEGFTSLGFDDHIKLFIDAGDSAHPAPGEDGPPPVMRDYTPRHYDADKNELDIDFAIHEAGPATRWAIEAKPGDKISIGGPRGSFVIEDDFDWYLFVGDETALPAIGRRLEELRPGAHAMVLAEVSGAANEQTFRSAASLSVSWLHRGDRKAGDNTILEDALRKLVLPRGDGYAWIACESVTAKRLRQVLSGELQHPKAWLKAAGYWRLGEVGSHEVHED